MWTNVQLTLNSNSLFTSFRYLTLAEEYLANLDLNGLRIQPPLIAPVPDGRLSLSKLPSGPGAMRGGCNRRLGLEKRTSVQSFNSKPQWTFEYYITSAKGINLAALYYSNYLRSGDFRRLLGK